MKLSAAGPFFETLSQHRFRGCCVGVFLAKGGEEILGRKKVCRMGRSLGVKRGVERVRLDRFKVFSQPAFLGLSLFGPLSLSWLIRTHPPPKPEETSPHKPGHSTKCSKPLIVTI